VVKKWDPLSFNWCIIALPLSENATASQSWRFVALEVRVMSAKKEALQALSIPQNVVWNPFTFRAKEIDESVDRGGDTLVNQRIRLRQFEVTFCYRPKCLNCWMGYFRLSEDRHSWKSSQQSTASAANRSFSEDGMFSVFSLAPLGHSSVTPLPVWNISAGFRCGALSSTR
jgi:hypothetical protein